MNGLYKRMNVSIQLLSPLHIGSGAELLLDYDIVPYRGRTYRVNEDTLLERALAKAEATGMDAVNRVLVGRPARELLLETDYAQPNSPLFRYVMPGEPSARTPGAKVKEQIKDVYDQVYLPGSSLKGALRTILAWSYYATRRRWPDLNRLGGGRSGVAQKLEHEIFGTNPNRDWLRALRVEDSQPMPPAGHLSLVAVRVHPTAAPVTGRGLDIDVEAIPKGTLLHTAITVDEYGFQKEVAECLGWKSKRDWLDKLATLARDHAQQRLRIELDYFQQRRGPAAVLQFYRSLLEIAKTLTEGEFIVQVGWGTGWESKTLGSSLLRRDNRTFEQLLRMYRMTKERQRQPGDPFPKSRHLVLDERRQPTMPLGWVKIKLE
ncbi:MAG: type III-A CRISPR-associated RAMP protein Csm5 [Anaerolineae bacterium]